MLGRLRALGRRLVSAFNPQLEGCKGKCLQAAETLPGAVARAVCSSPHWRKVPNIVLQAVWAAQLLK